MFTLSRYEDLIERPEASLPGLLEYLGVDSSVDRARMMVSAASGSNAAMDQHRTAPTIADSIGRNHWIDCIGDWGMQNAWVFEGLF